jgi:transcriptional regulator
VRHNPDHAVSDPLIVRRLIEENPWATLVSRAGDEVVASHYPVLLEEGDDGTIVVVTHLGRPDERIHDLGTGEMLMIFAGPSGYVSPSWYADGAVRIPTWNFSVAHCYGVPEILSPEENVAVLNRLVEHFEKDVERPELLDPALAAAYAPGTVGIRMVVTRFVAKMKLSGDEDPATRRQVVEALRRPGRFHNPALADEMERAAGGNG